jgi:transcription elongation factor Elf1/DNA-directed RNA polymerase subunit RPC12/RpoP
MDVYNDAIVSVKDKKTLENLSHIPRNLCLISHMYSNTKIPTIRFELNGKLISRNNALIVGYKCMTCSVINEITLNLYLRKANKHTVRCDACKNQEEDKRKAQSIMMTENKIAVGESIATVSEKKWSEKSLSERLDESYANFEKEDDVFKMRYFLQHLTLEEYGLLQSKIISIGHDKITDLSEWTYIPHYKIGNQTKYTPMLYNCASNAVVKPNYIKWNCEVCESMFVSKELDKQKNRIKLLCADCGFSNKTFKIKSFKTPWGKINYQSQYEKRFIDWCIENKIEISNGPVIEYDWKDTLHKYKVDFQCPTLKLLVELKDNHIWHKRQIESGKWNAKETITKYWCETKDWQYKLVFPRTMSSFKSELLKLK